MLGQLIQLSWATLILTTKKNINILCLQEVELEHDYDSTLLNLMGNNLETEINSLKRLTAIYYG